MRMLGDTNHGWFAKLAHGCEWATRKMLNLISCRHGWGDKLYGRMDAAASAYVSDINHQTINQALASGATQQQALATGSAAMEALANPEIPSIASLSPDLLGSLTPLLIGAAVLGGTYLLTDTLSRNT